MYPSVKRLLGAVLLLATVGASSVMAVRATATESTARSAPDAAYEVSRHG